MKKLLFLVLLVPVFILSGCSLVDISGTWTGTVTFESGACGTGTYDFNCTIEQDGESLSGTVTLNGDDYAFAGNANAGVFEWEGDEVSAEPWQSVEFSGVSTDGSSASGTFVLYTDGDCYGTFSISRN